MALVRALTALEGANVVSSVAEDVPGPGTTTDLGPAIRQARRQKLPDEIALLKSRMRAAEAGMARVREVLRPGVSELECFVEIQKAVVTAAGKGVLHLRRLPLHDRRAAEGGRPPDPVPRQRGDLYTLDYSVVLDGYRSDFTNTFAVGQPAAPVSWSFRDLPGRDGGGREGPQGGS